jgi:hypothetical protein
MPIKRDKICTKCQIPLTEENWIFSSDKYKKKSYICDGCRKSKGNAAWHENKEHNLEVKSDYRMKVRVDTINHYGGKCAICQIDNIYYLSIDHINGGGNIDRKIKKLGSGYNFYLYLQKNGYPDGFRVLCYNDNCSVSACIDYENKDPRHKKNREDRKRLIVNAYGGECAFCQHSIIQHLTIDHINGVSEEDMNRRSGMKLYKYLIDNDFPKDNYQLLCYNCNLSKGFSEYYPGSDVWNKYNSSNIGIINVQ